MSDVTVKESPKKADDAAAPAGQTLILDFGTKSKRQIKRLRKGTGGLMMRVNDTVAEFRRDKTISATSPVVVVVVKQKKKATGFFG
jgi:hypothetical protein